jgi:hypothetical protein
MPLVPFLLRQTAITFFLKKQNISKETRQIKDRNNSLAFSSKRNSGKRYFKEEQVCFIRYLVMILRYFMKRTYFDGSKERNLYRIVTNIRITLEASIIFQFLKP